MTHITEERSEGAGWRAIDSAPKDGTHVILGDAVEQYVAEAFFDADAPTGGRWTRANEHWTDAHDTELRGMTHWMPLPAPPASKE